MGASGVYQLTSRFSPCNKLTHSLTQLSLRHVSHLTPYKILQSGCVKVTFVGGLKNDDMDEEADNELDEYPEYEDGSDDDSDDMDCL